MYNNSQIQTVTNLPLDSSLPEKSMKEIPCHNNFDHMWTKVIFDLAVKMTVGKHEKSTQTDVQP